MMIMILSCVNVLATTDVNFTALTPADGTTLYNDYFSVLALTNGTTLVNDFNNELLGFWRFETYNQAEDTTANGRDGIVEASATWNSTCKFGSCYSFGTTDRSIEMQNDPELRMNFNTGNFSVFAWVYFNTSDACAAGDSAIDTRDANDDGWTVRFGGNCDPLMSINTIDLRNATLKLNDSAWHLVGFVADMGDQGSLYVDGVLHDDEDISAQTINVSSANMTIGQNSYQDAGFFPGWVDNVMVFNRSLSVQEILAMYDAGTTNYNRQFTELDAQAYSFNMYAEDSNGNLINESRTVTIGCVPLEDDLAITTNTTLCDETYNIIDTNSDGVAKVSGNNIFLDCRNNNIIGNTTGLGINVTGKNNTIRNCAVSNYTTSIYGIVSTAAATNNQYLYNSLSNCERCMRVLGNGVIVDSNNVSCDRMATGSAIAYSGTSTDGVIRNNRITQDCSIGIDLIFNTDRTQIYNNTINNIDIGIRVSDTEHVLIRDNTINNASNDLDAYGVGIFLRDQIPSTASPVCQNITVTSNTFDQMSSSAVLVTGCENSTISSNTISMATFTERANMAADDRGEPPCAFYTANIFKNFDQGSSNSYFDTIVNTSETVQRNIIISGNTVTDHQCFLVSRNSLNVTHDFTSYYRRDIQLASEVYNTTTWIIPTTTDHLQMYTVSLFSLPTGVKDYLFLGYFGTGTNGLKFFNYSIGRNFDAVWNANATGGYTFTYQDNGATSWIFNSSSTTGANIATAYTETMGIGNRTYRFNVTANQPRPSVIDLGITSIRYYNTGSRVDIDIEGTGNVNMTDVLAFQNTYGVVDIYSSDIYYASTENDDYTFGTGNWHFLASLYSSVTTSEAANDVVGALNTIATFLGVIIIASIGFLIIGGLFSEKFQIDEVEKMVIALVVVGVLLTVAIIIVNNVFRAI